MKIRLLTQEDWKIWKPLRLEALQEAPTNFGFSHEEEIQQSDLAFQERLNKNDIFGAFIGDTLVGSIGFYRLNTSKTKHRGFIWGMYVRPEHRGQSIASNLIEAVIIHAKSLVLQLHLSCVTDNPGAI